MPIQKHPIQTKFCACFSTFSVNFVFERIPIACTSRIFSINWSSGKDVLWNSIYHKSVQLMEKHLIPFLSKDINTRRRNIFQQYLNQRIRKTGDTNFNICSIKWLKLFKCFHARASRSPRSSSGFKLIRWTGADGWGFPRGHACEVQIERG